MNHQRVISRLRHLSTGWSLVRQGLFSGFAFLSFGLTGTISVFPTEDKGPVAQPITKKEAGDRQMAEQCYWREDMRLFNSFQEQGDRTTPIPCEEMITSIGTLLQNTPTPEDKALDTLVRDMTDGYPIETMAPVIARYDREVAGLIVGIAKKESNWGKRVPRDAQGNDCFNYWGYKGAGTRGVAMGHGCFGSQEEAVTVIGDRLKKLTALRKTSAPAKMIVWKCGSSCQGHSDESVRKWIADVSLYYHQIAN